MYPVENSAFSIVIEDILTDLDRRVLTYLYLPIIGEKALSIYQTLFTMVNPLEKESSILSHSQVLNLLKLSAKANKGAIPIPPPTNNGFLLIETSNPLPKPTNTSNSIPFSKLDISLVPLPKTLYNIST